MCSDRASQRMLDRARSCPIGAFRIQGWTGVAGCFAAGLSGFVGSEGL